MASWLLAAAAAAAANITVSVKPSAPVVIATAQARFEAFPNGSIRGSLPKGGTLDSGADAGDSVEVDGVRVDRFTTDHRRIRTSGGRVKRVVIPARAEGPHRIERTATLEIDVDFPNLLLSTVAYKNTGTAPVRLGHVVTQQHRLNTERLWSFHGASAKWGLDDVVEITPGFSRPNVMGTADRQGNGGGVPLVAFWTATTGLAVGHLEPAPLVLSIPVSGSRVAIELESNAVLQPGESYLAPRTFLMVYQGDYYEPLRTYSLAIQRQGWKLPKPSEEAYAVSWCGWGYGFNVTAKEMLGVIPKLKEYKIHWATLDDRWFDTYGDWNPRPDTFPGRSIREMVEEYHRQGILVQLWWVPLGAEIPGRTYSSHKYIQSQVAREHPDWLVLDPEGKTATMTRGLATLCPALPAVQQYHKQLTERFLRDWGFDGHKLDNIFTVPPCYNPAHHHKSPYDSIQAMGEVYRVIYETSRALKPQSVTQSCPCGTPPNIAWLPFMDQAVTADPVGSAQVRRRIKMYKALLGPQAPVYGDHVELTEVRRQGQRPPEPGRDFASTLGLGAVVGTKFVWPQTDARYRRVSLNEEKDRDWKKWMDLYHDKMLSRGEFRNLYVLGYDTPEGYAIAKGGKMYYAFFAPFPDASWSGEVELRGLKPGRYRVFDYVHNQELASVDAARPRLRAEFIGSLLLEVTP